MPRSWSNLGVEQPGASRLNDQAGPAAPAIKVMLAGAVAVVIWGGGTVASKFAVIDLPPLAVAALRTVLGGALALPLALAGRIALPRDAGSRGLLALSALSGFILFPIVFSLGLAHTSAIHGVVILAFMPVLTGLIAQVWDRRRPTLRWWIGCGVALAGEAVLVFWRGVAVDHGPTPANPLLGDALVALGSLCAATGYVAGGRLNRRGYSSQGATYWGVVVASLALLPALPFMLDGLAWTQATPASLASLAYLAAGVTILGYILWYWALGQGGIARIGMFQFAQPVVGVALAAALLGEPLGPSVAVACAAVLAGVWIAMSR